MVGKDRTDQDRAEHVAVDDELRPRHAAGEGGTVYPVNVGSLEWALRYGTEDSILVDRFMLASVVSRYAHLIDPRITQTDAIAALKRARKAQRDILA